jgi:hypothetical protein
VLALLALDSFLDNFDIAVLTRPACNSIDYLAESPFEYGAFFSLSSFSLAIFFNFQQRSVTWVSVLQWVQYIGPDSVFVFLPLFVTLFSDFANLVLLLVRSLSLLSRSFAGGALFCLMRSHSLIHLALSSHVGR